TTYSPEHAYIASVNSPNIFLDSPDVPHASDTPPHLSALVASSNTSSDSLDTWHRRLGHIMTRSVQKLFRQDMVKGMNISNDEGHHSTTCKACLEGKQTRAPISKESDVTNPSVLHRVYSDLVGPIEPRGRGGERYFMTFLDGHSHYLKVALLKSKDEAEGHLK